MKTYRLIVAILGTFLVILTAAVSAAYAMFAVFPFYFAIGYIALWLIAKSRTALRPTMMGIFGASALAIATAIYIGNRGNWNDPDSSWVFIAAAGGIVLLGVNVFAIYLRYSTSNVVALFGGPTLLITSAMAYWWLLDVNSSRADLYMLRANTIFAGLYLLLGTILVVDRTHQGAGADAASDGPRHLIR